MYEKELKQLEKERIDLDNDELKKEELRKLKERLIKLNEEIESSKKQKAEDQAKYFGLKNEYEELITERNNMWKVINNAQSNSPIIIQDEITSLE